ncbi:hypothetical protein H310_05543 [Aphanomyces invadans]|uniref:protein acetyllysine N-acetyltransferase n=1 Tax=Aphanomyces invadans TaxID=157072 RepID=A0A024UA13_9STRA|nr:hypothetical protein H310_05543 [Aphanomyces invadans]ETW03119.1 hypothetical protein H310_05543 [Aphanomyces invadans]RHY34675.1 hypothetical protein DYB32_000754 [Aphanomyces invadans]|eukprot:XP_008868503.1 hypothetical protein H310_05543 [Aphanomyces invadans]
MTTASAKHSLATLLSPVQDHDAFDQQCKRLAHLIKTSKHLVAFTGAGISTSTGVPDYRGENGIRKKSRRTASSTTVPPVIPDLHSLVPSPTHMALYELYRLGYLKHIVSQNVDNLHRKSGIPQAHLTEVHGNATFARCDTCEKVYKDNFPLTGLCNNDACPSMKKPAGARLAKRTRHGNGRLKRYVIGFNEPMDDIDIAIDHCEIADTALVLGTSLRVEPFCEMAGDFAKQLIIVNLQKTLPRLDKRAEETGVRLYASCDLVMSRVMEYLMADVDPGYIIPPWTGEHPAEVCHFEDEPGHAAMVNVLAGTKSTQFPSVLA